MTLSYVETEFLQGKNMLGEYNSFEFYNPLYSMEVPISLIAREKVCLCERKYL